MRLRRTQGVDVPAPTPEDVGFCLDVAVLVRDGLEGYRRLLREFETRGAGADLRAAALSMARTNAAYLRLGFVSAEQLHANLGESLWPDRGLAVLRELSYALVALGQDEPDVATLLSEEQLDALLRETDVAEWLQPMLERVPADWSVS